MANKICEILGIEKPIIQGPMAWVSTAPLVAAVSNAGGLGVLGVGFAPLDIVAQQIVETRKLTDKPFAVNTMMIPQLLDAVTKILVDLRVPVVYADSLGALNEEECRKYFDVWHKAGAKIVVKIGTVADAQVCDRAGADVIVAKGWEGGGHTSMEATMVLVPLVVDAVKAPVVASGGIADGRGMAAAIALGARGIEMGTAFMVAAETTIAPIVKEEMVKTGDMQTVVIGYCTGEPCRQIINPLAVKLMEIEAKNTAEVAIPILKEAAASTLRIAMMDGDIENGAIMAGQIVPMIQKVKPAQAIMDDVLTEAKNVLDSMRAFTF